MQRRSGQKVKVISIEEANRQIQTEKEAMLISMPEDAIMIQGQGGSAALRQSEGRINQSSQYMLDSEEEFLMTSATSVKDSYQEQERNLQQRSNTTH